MLVPEIITTHLHLREFRMHDLDDFSSIVGHPEVMKYFGAGKTLSKQEAESILKGMIIAWGKRGFGRWAVIHKGHGKLIGYCGFRVLDGLPELSYVLAQAYWGQGLATEACTACLRYGFEDRQFDRIVAAVRVENVASQRVLKKIGMLYKENRQYEGLDFMYFEIWREQHHQTLLDK